MPLSPKIQPIAPPPRHDKNRHFAQSPLYKFAKIRIRQHAHLSPLFASDDVLAKMPTTHLVVSAHPQVKPGRIPNGLVLFDSFYFLHFQAAHLDPCLDDSVMFARKLDSLGVDVHLDAIDEVPHGFLNFAQVSAECLQATNLCKEKLRTVLGITRDLDE